MERDIALLAKQTKAFEPVFVARQPIFTAKNDVWGYKLLFRPSLGAETADIEDPEVATAKVLADGFALAHSGLGPDKKAIIPFPEKLLRKDAPLALPKEICVIELPDAMKADPANMEAVQRIKDAGFTLAVKVPCYEAVLNLVDLALIHIQDRPKAELVKITQQVKQSGKKLLASKVEDKESYGVVRALGFSLYQGYHFSKPQIVQGRKISPSEASRIRLVHELSSPEYEVSQVAQIIASDISLSYRLLRFINSASFSLREPVKSLDHAITIIGQRPLKLWLMAVAISDVNSDPTGKELTFLSLQRGRFLELLAEEMDSPPYHKDIMLLLGLFSLLDALMGQEMRQITEHLPLEQEIKAALEGEENTARALIGLAETVEQGDWSKVNGLLGKFGLSAKDAAIKHNLSALWAQEVMTSTQIEAPDQD